MPSPARRLPSQSPSKQVDNQLEAVYNTAVQSFIRRDHVTTQATLARLIKLLTSQKYSRNRPWFELVECQSPDIEYEDWLVKTIKLVVSSHASLYAEPPADQRNLPNELRALLPPSSPDLLLSHIQKLCMQTYFDPSTYEPQLLPPPLFSTLLLASIKLSVPFAHRLAEEWLSLLPDAFIISISPDQGRPARKPEFKKRVESAREGYLKVVELFMGQVLAREGEWDMARGFLEGESVMPSKRKENLYRHLRSLQATSGYNSASPTNSAILTPTSSRSPSSKPNGVSRSRSSSASSSSSERTARPVTSNVNGQLMTNVDRKGKARSIAGMEEQRSESSVPSKIFVDHPRTPSRATPSARSSGLLEKLLATLPNAQARLRRMSIPHWLASTLAIPLPIMFLVVSLIAIRRRLARRRGVPPPPIVAGSATVTVHAMDDIRARLMRARRQGFLQWLSWWLSWWASKIAGVWKLGTTITYV